MLWCFLDEVLRFKYILRSFVLNLKLLLDLLNLYHLKWTPVSILFQVLLLLLNVITPRRRNGKPWDVDKANILQKNCSGSQLSGRWDSAVLVHSEAIILLRHHIRWFLLALGILGESRELCHSWLWLLTGLMCWSGRGRGPLSETMGASRENLP